MRPIDRDNPAEVLRVVALQTEGFFSEEGVLPVFEGLLRGWFHAEVRQWGCAVGVYGGISSQADGKHRVIQRIETLSCTHAI